MIVCVIIKSDNIVINWKGMYCGNNKKIYQKIIKSIL